MMKTTPGLMLPSWYQEVELSRRDSAEILDMVLQEIANELAACK